MTTESTQRTVALVRTRGLPVQRRSVYAGGQSGEARQPVRRGGRMRRLLAMLVFLVGGFAAEMAHPVQCTMVNVTRVRLKLRKD